jgi:hypothetical protein
MHAHTNDTDVSIPVTLNLCSGPALDPPFSGTAHILLTPDTPAVQALAPVSLLSR